MQVDYRGDLFFNGFFCVQSPSILYNLAVWLVENLEGPVGPSARSTLLVKAVEDCFLGRHFIFGIK
ncbi:hypothetical protein XENOCAPTIV_026400, partial [Xenoophorus captivus]